MSKAEVVLDCGATTAAGGGEAIADLVEEAGYKRGGCGCHIDPGDRAWFKFANGEWGQALSMVWLPTPVGWVGIYLLDARYAPGLMGAGWPDNRDLPLGAFHCAMMTMLRSDQFRSGGGGRAIDG